MSTRCNIILREEYGRSIYLYHHHDGYPSGVGSLLLGWLRDKSRLGCWDAEHFATELVRVGIPYTGRDWRTGEEQECIDDEYECSVGLHGDIEFLYVIDCSREKLTCYRREFGTSVSITGITKDDNIVEIPEPKK